MELLKTTVPLRALEVTRTESIPRWRMASRLALGALTFALPCLALLVGSYALAAAPHAPPALSALGLFLITTYFMLSLLYVSFAMQNPRLRSKGLWMTTLVLVAPVAMPTYWLLHVLHAPKVGRNDVDYGIPRRGHRLAAHPITSVVSDLVGRE